MDIARKLALMFAAGVCAAAPAIAQQNASAVVVQAHVDAYRAGDIGAFMDTFADNAVLTYDGQRFVGKAQIRHAYSMNFQPGAPSIYIAASEMREGRLVLSEGYILADGTDICCSLSYFTVKNGKITRIDTYSPS
ncbi:nuclear transport factor 2 family protein [Pontixanthobacter aquaemixtae]|uniref:SnoaL-like domain-containing protein n=1 Tax=Pontixanthobacter aquaemixtae TaxID=1958940 RepID=A0A844ZPK0_9SPHN|nr:nuclear transport factor 2 family protein [Pontixanthobacter aquaemixtae]MXO89765.1 hypothetical protein [Pontixanthobacter aquaemixtae]